MPDVINAAFPLLADFVAKVGFETTLAASTGF
jgi:hypothetical protein